MVRVVTIACMNIHSDHSRIIDQLGGTTKVAALCQVKSQAVSRWRRDGIPQARLMYLQLIAPKAFTGKREAA